MFARRRSKSKIFYNLKRIVKCRISSNKLSNTRNLGENHILVTYVITATSSITKEFVKAVEKLAYSLFTVRSVNALSIRGEMNAKTV